MPRGRAPRPAADPRPAGPKVSDKQGQPKKRSRSAVAKPKSAPLPSFGRSGPSRGQLPQGQLLAVSDLPTPATFVRSSDWGQHVVPPWDEEEDVLPSLRQHVVARGWAMMERWGQPYPRPVQPPPLGEDDLRALAMRHAGTARSGSLQYLADMARELQGQIIEVSDSNDSDENSWLKPDFSQSSPSPTPEGVGGTPDDSGQSAHVVRRPLARALWPVHHLWPAATSRRPLVKAQWPVHQHHCHGQRRVRAVPIVRKMRPSQWPEACNTLHQHTCA